MPTWNQIAEQLGHDPDKSAAWNRWRFWTNLGVDVGPEPPMDGPKTGTPEADEEIRAIDASDAPPVQVESEAAAPEVEDLPLYARIVRGVAEWSSPETFRDHELDRFEIVLYREKGAAKKMTLQVRNTGRLDIRNFGVTEAELRDRYAGTALVFRRRAGRSVRLDTTFTVEG